MTEGDVATSLPGRPAFGSDTAPKFAAGELDDLPWAWQSGRYLALEFDFGVRAMDESLGRYLGGVLAPHRTGGQPANWFSIVDAERCGLPVPTTSRYLIYINDEFEVATPHPPYVVSHILWRLNQRVVADSTSRYVLLHASAAERDGNCAIFPAPMESGKTTLIAGLVRAGLRYVTDEAVAIDPDTGLVQPFPKALSIDEGSWEVLPDLRPSLDDDLAAWVRSQWHVSPLSIRADAIAPVSRPRFIIAPRYEKGSATVLEPMRRAEALVYVIGNAFEGNQRGRPWFDALGRVVGGADCFRLPIGDLDRACALVLDLFEREGG